MSDGPEDGFERLARVEAAAGHIPEVAELVRDCERWIEDATDAPLQLYFRFPESAFSRRIYRRNKWLKIAARQIEAPGPSSGAALLKAELDAFVERGPWRAWREDGAPPEGASRLRTALYWVATFNDGEGLSQRTFQNIVGNEWR